jgi:murein DD-endopeptidase MepM/ murein hydrolase activator NlpD
MLAKKGMNKFIQRATVLSLLILTIALGKMWFNQKSVNDKLQLQVRIMEQKAARIVELEQNAAVLMKDLNSNSTKVVAGTLSQVRLKKYIKGWDKNPVAEISEGTSLEGYVTTNPYEVANSALGGLTKVEEHLSRFVSSLQSTNKMLETKNQVLAGVPSVKPANGWISSPYGKRRSPVNGKWVHHNGLDIAAPLGSTVVASAAGRILHAGWKGAFGRLVEIDHGKGVVTRYGHNGKLFVKKGDYVVRGQKISTIGMTGRTTGPHLHYEIHVKKKSVNPKRYIDIAPVQHFADPVVVAKIDPASPVPMGGAENPIQATLIKASEVSGLSSSLVLNKAFSTALPFGALLVFFLVMIKNQRFSRLLANISQVFTVPFMIFDSLLEKKQPEYDGSEPVAYWQERPQQPEEYKKAG